MTYTRHVIAASAFADGRNLAARQTLHAWLSPPRDISRIVLDDISGKRGGILLDVGCGNGIITNTVRKERKDLTVLAVDLSPGMLKETGPPAVVAEVERLPLTDNKASIVLALHMLYFAQDVSRAVRELRRVILEPAGLLLASTTPHDDKPELDQIFRLSAADVLGGKDFIVGRPRHDHRFNAENAVSLLSSDFDRVSLREYRSEIRVPTEAPVIAYIQSCRFWYEGGDEEFQAILQRLRYRIHRAIERQGVFRISSSWVLVVCS